MLPKVNRLTKEKDFEAVFRKGKSIKNDFLLFKILKNDFKANRFGFIVSNKISNKATVRNKIKRRLRDVVWGEFKNMYPSPKLHVGVKKNRANLGGPHESPEVKKFVDVVIITLPGIKKKKFSDIQKVIGKFSKNIIKS